MKIYYNPIMFPNAPEECIVEDVEFIHSDVNQIMIESEGDEEKWEEILNNPDGFLDYVAGEIYESLDEKIQEEYAHTSVSRSPDILEYEFIISRLYLD